MRVDDLVNTENPRYIIGKEGCGDFLASGNCVAVRRVFEKQSPPMCLCPSLMNDLWRWSARWSPMTPNPVVWWGGSSLCLRKYRAGNMDVGKLRLSTPDTINNIWFWVRRSDRRSAVVRHLNKQRKVGNSSQL